LFNFFKRKKPRGMSVAQAVAQVSGQDIHGGMLRDILSQLTTIEKCANEILVMSKDINRFCLEKDKGKLRSRIDTVCNILLQSKNNMIRKEGK